MTWRAVRRGVRRGLVAGAFVFVVLLGLGSLAAPVAEDLLSVEGGPGLRTYLVAGLLAGVLVGIVSANSARSVRPSDGVDGAPGARALAIARAERARLVDAQAPAEQVPVQRWASEYLDGEPAS